jgi:hypothetical protein
VDRAAGPSARRAARGEPSIIAGDLTTILSLAIGFALSPARIAELILVLFSTCRVVNSVAFVVALLQLTR